MNEPGQVETAEGVIGWQAGPDGGTAAAGPPAVPLDLEKLRSIGHLSKGRTVSRSKSGREHPDSGEPFKRTRDELGNYVTEHGRPGSGVSDRQDAEIRPDTLKIDLRDLGRKADF